uniref:Uncharacterized protein n=1 Tax=Romanomermis culicivorax TaxID=13658 RepID=A0A915J8B6_ROMCU
MRILLAHNYKYANYAKRLFVARYPIRDHETIQLLLDQHNNYRRS